MTAYNRFCTLYQIKELNKLMGNRYKYKQMFYRISHSLINNIISNTACFVIYTRLALSVVKRSFIRQLWSWLFATQSFTDPPPSCTHTHPHTHIHIKIRGALYRLTGNTNLSLTRKQVMSNIYDIHVSYFTVIAFSTKISLLFL